MFFLYETNNYQLVVAASEDVPEDFAEGCSNLKVGSHEFKDLKWTNLDYEITDSALPDDFLLKMGKYAYIGGELHLNEHYVEEDLYA